MGEGVYNGDLGTIMSIDLYEQTLEVLFDDGRSAVYAFSMLEELELAYCISIHKSQGSEFPIVLLPLLGGPPMLLNRNLLYTAVTRARHMVYILGRQSCIQQMVRNNQVKRRYSAWPGSYAGKRSCCHEHPLPISGRPLSPAADLRPVRPGDPPGPIRTGRILLPGLLGKAAARFPSPKRSVIWTGSRPGCSITTRLPS